MKRLSLHCTSSVLLLACLVLFTQIIHSSIAQTLSLTVIDQLQPNMIIVTCHSVPGPYTFTFTSPDDGSSEVRPPATQNTPSYTFTVTPNNETTVKCRGSATSESNSITFAAYPVYDHPVIRMLGLTGRTLELECPYQLGIANNSIDPYHYVWLYANNSDVEIPGSGRRRTFSVDVNQNSTALYSCAIIMRRCSDCKNVQALPLFSDRVKFRITKAEPISMVNTPENQRVNSSDSASFNCSARGSSIEIIWQYNGENYTMANSNSNIEVNNTSVLEVNGDVSADTVYSTLMINSVTANANVNCVVRQIFDGSIDPTFNNEDFAKGLQANEIVSPAALTVIPPPPTEPAPTTMEPSHSMTTLAPTPTASTAPSTGLADDVKIILISFAILIVIATSVIISLVIFLYCHYQYEYRRDSSKLGRFLSQAMSKPSSRIHHQSVHCGNPPNLINGAITSLSGTAVGSVADYKSDAGHKLVSNSSIVCQNDREWSTPPVCQESQLQEVVERIPQSLRIPGSHLKMFNTAIGQGKFGTVYKGSLMDWNSTSVQGVAVKAFKGPFTLKKVEDLASGIIKMQEFNHPNVMPLIGVCLDTGPGISVVMPFMTNGSLLDYLKKERSSLVIRGEEPVKVLAVRRLLLRICHQVALGMEYLTQQKFIHRDLAARNCMIDSSGNIKVGDFGLTVQGVVNVHLPYKWMAVESLTDNIFSEKTDVWSYGVTMWEIFSGGRSPYPAVDPVTLTKLLKRGRRLDAPKNDACSLDISALMARCWYVDPEERLGFSDLCSVMEQFLSLIPECTELKMVLVEGVHDYEDIERLAMSALVQNSVKDAEITENAACADQLSTVVNKNTNQAEYDDFSALKSRLPKLAQKSARGFENPVTTSATQYENIAHEATEVVENGCDACQVNTIADVNTEYDDFSSLRSRLAAQSRNSAEDLVITEKNIAYNVPRSLICHTENALHTCDDPNQLKAPEDENPMDYDNFSSLTARLATQIGSSCEGQKNPIEGTN